MRHDKILLKQTCDDLAVVSVGAVIGVDPLNKVNGLAISCGGIDTSLFFIMPSSLIRLIFRCLIISAMLL